VTVRGRQCKPSNRRHSEHALGPLPGWRQRCADAGVPQNVQSGASSTLTTRFANTADLVARGLGLGLSDDKVDYLTALLENGLYDPAFAHFDPALSLHPRARLINSSKSNHSVCGEVARCFRDTSSGFLAA
jgi:hypothetical protein